MIDKPFHINDKGSVSFQLDNCRLTPGYYSVHLTYKSTGNDIISDSIRNAISFRIVDYNQNADVSYHKDSLYVPEGNWNVKV